MTTRRTRGRVRPGQAAGVGVGPDRGRRQPHPRREHRDALGRRDDRVQLQLGHLLQVVRQHGHPAHDVLERVDVHRLRAAVPEQQRGRPDPPHQVDDVPLAQRRAAPGDVPQQLGRRTADAELHDRPEQGVLDRAQHAGHPDRRHGLHDELPRTVPLEQPQHLVEVVPQLGLAEDVQPDRAQVGAVPQQRRGRLERHRVAGPLRGRGRLGRRAHRERRPDLHPVRRQQLGGVARLQPHAVRVGGGQPLHQLTGPLALQVLRVRPAGRGPGCATARTGWRRPAPAPSPPASGTPARSARTTTAPRSRRASPRNVATQVLSPAAATSASATATSESIVTSGGMKPATTESTSGGGEGRGQRLPELVRARLRAPPRRGRARRPDPSWRRRRPPARPARRSW